MLIGEITFPETVEALAQTEAPLGPEVNPTVFSAAGSSAKAPHDRPSIRTVLNSPDTMLMGNEDGLEGLGVCAEADPWRHRSPRTESAAPAPSGLY